MGNLNVQRDQDNLQAPTISPDTLQTRQTLLMFPNFSGHARPMSYCGFYNGTVCIRRDWARLRRTRRCGRSAVGDGV